VLKGGSSFFWELQSALINLCSHRRTGTALFQFSFDFVRVKSYGMYADRMPIHAVRID
jgi:hypothetical protein